LELDSGQPLQTDVLSWLPSVDSIEYENGKKSIVILKKVAEEQKAGESNKQVEATR
jgi:hypothetical protein